VGNMEMTLKYDNRVGIILKMLKGAALLFIGLSLSVLQPVSAETPVVQQELAQTTAKTTLVKESQSDKKEAKPTNKKPKPTNKKPKLTPIETEYTSLIELIDKTLLEQQVQLKSNQKLLNQFVEQHILPHWNVELTLKQLIGSRHWKALSQKEIVAVKQAFVDTLNRYIAEGMKFYDGQRIKFVSAKTNTKNTRGFLTLKLEPIYLPSFNVSFKIANKTGQWMLYDVMVEGISYVKMKKGEYRQLITKHGLDGLLAHLDKKNTTVKVTESEVVKTSPQHLSPRTPHLASPHGWSVCKKSRSNF
jgi:ABC-type transporter MlaC component